MGDVAIKVENVSKTFRLPHEKHSSIKSIFINIFRPKRGYELQKALNDVSFEVKKGEFFGIVGRNGSGKSTLLKMLAGIYSPTRGSIQVNGKLTPFIELGVGFNQELTGRENVYLNGALLGFNRKEMNAMYEDIVTFAELEKFMDQKLKNYSSGMQVRLAFSIAIRAKSDILLIDEVLAVGDAAFQSKCFNYFHELKRKGTTVVFVSHDRMSLEQFCDRGILINEGKLVKFGDIRGVLKSYGTVVLNELDKDSSDTSRARKKSHTQVKIGNTYTQDSKGNKKTKFNYGEEIILSYEVKFMKSTSNPILGISVWQKNTEKAIFATNTLIEGNTETGSFSFGDKIKFKIMLPDNLNDGEYFVEPAVANNSATVFFDRVPEAARFFINGSQNPHSILSTKNTIKLDHTK